jgi:fumarylacetoacetate (FAA) hydrolase
MQPPHNTATSIAPPALPHKMKLATLKDGSRDGQLIVVSRDLTQAHFAAGIATRLQHVLDDWNFISPQLEDLYASLNGGKARHAFAFEPQRCMAPLPRAYQWVQASAYPSHGQRLGAASAGPAQPPLTQGCSDDFLSPCQDARFANADWGIDFSAGLAVITGDVRLGATPDEALDGIRLLMLANAWQLRAGSPAATDGAAAAPAQHALPPCAPAAAFAPLAVTPEELGTRWQEGRVHGSLSVHWNGRRVGHCDTGAGMAQHFGHWLAQVAQSRRVRAGSILGAGAASVADAAAQGASCIAELRALEQEEHGEVRTAYMQWGDTVRMEMLAENGQSIFGALEQRVVGADTADADADAQAAAEAKAAAAKLARAAARASLAAAEAGDEDAAADPAERVDAAAGVEAAERAERADRTDVTDSAADGAERAEGAQEATAVAPGQAPGEAPEVVSGEAPKEVAAGAATEAAKAATADAAADAASPAADDTEAADEAAPQSQPQPMPQPKSKSPPKSRPKLKSPGKPDAAAAKG